MTLSRTSSFFVKTIAQDLQNLPRVQKLELVCIFWPRASLNIESFHDESYSNFLEYIGNELNELRHHQSRFAVDNFESMIELMQILRDHSAKPLSRLILDVRSRFLNVDEASIRRSLELLVRLWLTLNVNSAAIAIGPIFAHARTLEWSMEQSLEDVIKSQFDTTANDISGLTLSTSKTLPTVSPGFTAANLVKICGIKLNWSDNLADHLNYNRKSCILAIYKHKVCLINHIKGPANSCPISVSVLEETLDTINLLFPFGDHATKRLLAQERQLAFYNLGNCGRDHREDLNGFRYWREQLEELDEAFNKPAQTLRQLFVDRRNLVDWAAFWITVMVLLLTLVSIPCNIIQTVYTVKSYNLAFVGAVYPTKSTDQQ
jgi:hypothetical protein